MKRKRHVTDGHINNPSQVWRLTDGCYLVGIPFSLTTRVISDYFLS